VIKKDTNNNYIITNVIVKKSYFIKVTAWGLFKFPKKYIPKIYIAM